MIEEIKLTKQQKRDKKRNEQNKNKTEHKVNKDNSKKKSNEKQHHQIKASGSSVYKRKAYYPQSYISNNSTPMNRFINPKDKEYNKILNTSYDGFELDKKQAFEDEFHYEFERALEELDNQNIYQFDVIQPLGLKTKLSKTYVSRCLVGTAGITYKYQGLRMFALPWEARELGATSSTISIGKLNESLIKRTEFLLKKNRNGKECGNCNYNLTLINRCYPDKTSELYPKMKLEPTFNQEKVTVSWHADSTLEHFSSIAVYQHTKEEEKTKEEDYWKLALRVCPNAEGPLQGKGITVEVSAPPLSIPLPNNACYYLLDEFNHHHQHSVLAGKSQRYASTHRVSRMDGHTFFSIKAKCIAALKGSGFSSKQIRSEQIAYNDLEFEWIRQFYIQGEKHRNKNIWWQPRLIELLNFWKQLEERSIKIIDMLSDVCVVLQNRNDDNLDKKEMKRLAKRKKRILSIDDQSFDEMIDSLQERYDKREGWIQRERDSIFKSEPIDCRPIQVPFPDTSPHPDCDEAITQLKDTINKLKIFKVQYEKLKVPLVNLSFVSTKKRTFEEDENQNEFKIKKSKT